MPLCRQSEDTWAHRCWSCEEADKIQQPAVQTSDALKPYAAKALNSNMHPMWLRGIIPMDWYQLPPPAGDAIGIFLQLKTQATMDISHATLYLDESGGQYCAEPLLRRAGWGLAAIQKGSRRMLGAISGTVEGSVQTATRAAIMALVFALDKFRGSLEVVPDSKYLVDGINVRRRHERPQGTNADA